VRILRPNERVPSVRWIDYARLFRRGQRVLLFDLENTLCLWRAGELGGGTRKLLRKLLNQGFRIAVLTNASLPKDHPVAQAFVELGIPFLTRAKKPLPFAFWRALRLLGAQKKEAVVIGDQLLTDVLGGKLAGIYTILVEPLSPKEARRTKFNRLVERLLCRPILRAPRGSGR